MTKPTTAIVREKLGKIWWLCDDASELTDEIVAIKILVHEVMALMESEQGERVAYGPIAAQFPIQEMLDRGWVGRC